MLDVIIIGAGPAGFTSAIFAARRQLKCIIIGKELGGQLTWASEIENYPAFSHIESFELVQKMQKQVMENNVEIVNGIAEQIKSENGIFTVFLSNKQEYKAKSLILALGLVPRKLNIPGEKEFLGRGVSYCANCDGPFFKQKDVVVIGGGNAALDAAEVMSKIAKKVYLIHKQNYFQGFEVLSEKVKNTSNIEIHLEHEVVEIVGENKVNSVKIRNNFNSETFEINTDGVFVEIGRMPNTELASEFIAIDEKGYIIVDAKCMTKTPGLFAAGDVTNIPFKQITTACGQGTIAALAAYEYLQLKK